MDRFYVIFIFNALYVSLGELCPDCAAGEDVEIAASSFHLLQKKSGLSQQVREHPIELRKDLPKINVTQSWSQETDYTRQVPYKVYGKGGPIIIALHGSFADGLQWESRFDYEEVQPNAGNFVLFMPTSYSVDGHMSWNNGLSPARAPDVEFVEQIVDEAAKMTDTCNISKGVGLVGSSSGCSLIMRILIESQKPELVRFLCYSASLTNVTYQNGLFYASNETSTDSFSLDSFYPANPQPHASNRILWMVHGTLDDTVPIDGGHMEHQPPGVECLAWEATGLAWSQAFGCTDKIDESPCSYGLGYSSCSMFKACSTKPYAVAWYVIGMAPHEMIRPSRHDKFWPHVGQMAADLFSMCDGCETKNSK